MGTEVIGADEINALSKLPSRQVLYGQLVGLIASPITGLARSLNGLPGGLAIALSGVLEKKQSGEIPAGADPAPAVEAAPAAEEAPAEEASAPAEAEPAVDPHRLMKPPLTLLPRSRRPRKLHPQPTTPPQRTQNRRLTLRRMPLRQTPKQIRSN